MRSARQSRDSRKTSRRRCYRHAAVLGASRPRVVEVQCPETGDYLGLEPTTPMMLTQRKKQPSAAACSSPVSQSEASRAVRTPASVAWRAAVAKGTTPATPGVDDGSHSVATIVSTRTSRSSMPARGRGAGADDRSMGPVGSRGHDRRAVRTVSRRGGRARAFPNPCRSRRCDLRVAPLAVPRPVPWWGSPAIGRCALTGRRRTTRRALPTRLRRLSRT